MFSHKSFRLLAIGNSFSDNALNCIYPVLEAFGVREIVVGNLYIGGCSIETHWQNALSDAPAYIYRKNTDGTFVNVDGAKMSQALGDEQWQFVTMQQASHFSGQIATYDDKIDNLARYVLQNVSVKPVIAWHETWAYQQNSAHPAFADYDSSQSEMFRRITQCVKERIVPNELFERIIPAGTAIQNARTSYLGDALTADGYHLDGLGELVAALTYVLALTGWDVSEMDESKLPCCFAPYLDVVRESAVNAVRDPFAVTPSRFVTDPSPVARCGCTVTTGVSYNSASETCKLDIYEPDVKSSATVVQLHGGGLRGGSRADDCYASMGRQLASRGVRFVSADYRLFPEAKREEFLSDCAEALAFVKNNVAKGSERLFVSGQSAGAYISMMLAFNGELLQRAGMRAEDVDGWVFESGQPTTHFEVLRRRNIADWTVAQRIDELAPLYYVGKNMRFRNALILAYSQDIPNRLEQNLLLNAALKNCGMGAETRFVRLCGRHVEASTYRYRGKYAYTELLWKFVTEKS